jgi:hypothetical protein
LDFLPTESGPSNSVGRYFETTSGSRNHRSGLYVFDVSNPTSTFKDNWFYETHTTNWILRLLKVHNALTISPSFHSLFISYVFFCHQTIQSNIFIFVWLNYSFDRDLY